MYNTAFSYQWIFDRCLETVDAHSPWVVITIGTCVALFGTIVLYFFFQKKFTDKKKRFLSTGIGFLIMLPVVTYIVSLVSFSVCSDSSFWASIGPAHELHGILKEQRKKAGIYPHTQAELTKLSPELMKEITENAKTTYTYNPSTDSYTWLIRPSKYYIAVFDNKKDYALYRLPTSFDPHHWSVSSFPPPYSGAWDKLPQ